MAWYRSGTVTSVAGTNVITGTGTLWNNPIFGIASGQMIFVPGAGQVVIYEILAVDSDTKIRVTKNISSAITNSEYAIVTTVSNSMSDLARRTAVQLALYQQFLEDWQNITTGTGDVTIIAPDGTEVVIPALSWISDSKTWFDTNKELFDILNTDAFTASQVVNTPWTNLTLQNGWVTAPGYRSVCRKINGMVYIDIHIINGTFTNWTTVTTLPVGYRPLTTMVLSSLATFSLPNLPKIYIQPTGEVQLLDVTGSSNILHLTYIITLQ